MNMTEILCCPDCRGDLAALSVRETVAGFSCDRCRTVFPVIDGIPVLLPKNSRNFALEFNRIESLEKVLPASRRKSLAGYFQNTRNILTEGKNDTSWEWEDEPFWSREYRKAPADEVPEKWNERLWQREFLVNRLLQETGLAGKIILDMGCGEGQNFRHLFASHCDESTLYLATDISLHGLKLNRRRNPHRNALYLLCSAESLPVKNRRVDLIFYFGVLHHTRQKSKLLIHHAGIVAPGGYLVIHEALERLQFSSFVPQFLRPVKNESAHEERIRQKELLNDLAAARCYRILECRYLYSLFFHLKMALWGPLLVRHRSLFRRVSALDRGLIRLFGSWIPLFRPGEAMLLVKKATESVP